MLKKKTKKSLKKLRLRMRMKRIQRIMQAIMIHKQLTDKQRAIGKSNSKQNQWAKKSIINRTEMLRGRIAASKKRSRDLWTGKKRKPA